MEAENMIDLNSIQILNLRDHPSYFDIVCEWLWSEWGKDGRTIDDIKYRTSHCLGKDSVPMTFVAVLNNEPVGTYSLWVNDLKSRQDLTPWFAVLYVKPEMRRQGIGALLSEHAMSIAKSLNYKKLYLITDLEGHYEKYGWKFVELAPLPGGKKTRVYEYSI